MNPRQPLAKINGRHWTPVVGPADDRLVFLPHQITFECPDCGMTGTMADAAEDNMTICIDCYASALAELED